LDLPDECLVRHRCLTTHSNRFAGHGATAGVFFIGILNNGLNLYNVSPYDQMVVKGGVLLIAASLDRWRSA
jgi:ribose/xylose/arabinose/galactoside ABC-type transport system permease subunit